MTPRIGCEVLLFVQDDSGGNRAMTPLQSQSPAVFLDRDGTIMRDVDYCGDPKDVDLLPGAADSLKLLKGRGYKLIVITNQSGIGRGYFDENGYRAVESEVARQVGPGVIEATYFCPHLPQDGCKCRKPSPEMILRAAREHHIDLSRSFFVGDKKSDMETGRNAGMKTILVQTGYGKDVDPSLAYLVAADLRAAAELILKRGAEGSVVIPNEVRDPT